MLTKHASIRMSQRAITPEAIEAVLEFGRAVYTRGVIIHAIGKKEVARYGEQGVDLSAFEGIQVVLAGDGATITAYRNRDFRGLRAGLGRGRFNRKKLYRSRLVKAASQF